MSYNILKKQASILEKNLEDAKSRLSKLEKDASSGKSSPSYKEMYETKKEISEIEKSLLRVQSKFDNAHQNRYKGPEKY